MAVLGEQIVDELLIDRCAEKRALCVIHCGLAEYIDLELVLSRAQAEREIANCTDCVGIWVEVCVDRGRTCNDRIKLGLKSDFVAVFVLAHLVFVPPDKQSHLAQVACKNLTRSP